MATSCARDRKAEVGVAFVQHCVSHGVTIWRSTHERLVQALMRAGLDNRLQEYVRWAHRVGLTDVVMSIDHLE